MCDFCLGEGLVINLPNNVHVCNSCFDNIFCSSCRTHVHVVGPTSPYNNEFWCNACIQDDIPQDEPQDFGWGQPIRHVELDGWDEPPQAPIEPRPFDFDNNSASEVEYNPELSNLLQHYPLVFWQGHHLWSQHNDIYDSNNRWVGAIFGNTIAWR